MRKRRYFSVPPDDICTLTAHQIPKIPESDLWTECLRWMVMVMDRNDPQLELAASCLAYSLKNGGLTKRQANACQEMYDRIVKQLDRLELDCQWFMTEKALLNYQMSDAAKPSKKEMIH